MKHQNTMSNDEINQTIAAHFQSLFAVTDLSTLDFCSSREALNKIESLLTIDDEYDYGEFLREGLNLVGPRGGHHVLNGWGCYALACAHPIHRAHALVRLIKAAKFSPIPNHHHYYTTPVAE
jgi:hypothetical protein